MYNSKVLFLFTDTYPYKKFESFLETEISYIANRFDKIYIFPINVEGEIRNIPNNTEVVDIHKKVSFDKRYLLFDAISYIIIIIIELLYNKKAFKGFRILNGIKILFNAFSYKRALEKFIKEKEIRKENIIGYSYWFYHWSLVSSLLKKDGAISKTYSRAHSFDLYDDIKYNYFSFAKVSNSTKIFPISLDGERYLKSKIRKSRNKIEKLYLGTFNSDIKILQKENKEFLIVSCSAIRDIKRVHLIPNILKKINLPIKWIHFGDGLCREKLNENIKKLPSNIKVEIKGYTSNSEVLNYYRTNYIDLFINFSIKEGVPVSLMEASSFGIPLLATNIYAVGEIVNNNTGTLIDKDMPINKVSLVVEKMLTDDKYKQIDYRKNVRRYWNSNFNAEKNYNCLVNEMYSE